MQNENQSKEEKTDNKIEPNDRPTNRQAEQPITCTNDSTEQMSIVVVLIPNDAIEQTWFQVNSGQKRTDAKTHGSESLLVTDVRIGVRSLPIAYAKRLSVKQSRRCMKRYCFECSKEDNITFEQRIIIVWHVKQAIIIINILQFNSSYNNTLNSFI